MRKLINETEARGEQYKVILMQYEDENKILKKKADKFTEELKKK